jgi:CubicO group peptidase (beta-lactamase class C family)
MDGARTGSGEWTLESPATVGLEPECLEDFARDLHQRCPAARALLVVRNRALVREDYWHGCRPQDRHHCFSVTKSVTSVLIGMAIAEGVIAAADETVDRWLPDCACADQRMPRLRDLLTMTADGFCPGVPKAGLQRAQVPPGTQWGERFHYSDHQANLAARCLDRALQGRSAEFARERLLRPLGIRKYEWYQDETGGLLGGYGLVISARDLARFALLCLEQGAWGAYPVFTPEWWRLSTTAHVAGGDPVHLPYGYFWWISGSGDSRIIIAAGFHGQRIYLVPAAGMAIIVTAEDAGGDIDGVVLPWLSSRGPRTPA